MTLRLALTAVAAAAASALAVSTAGAETGGSGLLPPDFAAPGEYGIAKGPRGLELLKPPSKLACNSAGENGTTVRFYAGARYTKAVQRRGVSALRAGLYSGSGRLITHINLKPASRFQTAYLDRIGPGPRCGAAYSIQYTYRLDGKHKRLRRSFKVTVTPAS